MQDLFDKKDTRSCEACGLTLSYKMSKKTNGLTPNGQLLCKTCARVSIYVCVENIMIEALCLC